MNLSYLLLVTTLPLIVATADAKGAQGFLRSTAAKMADETATDEYTPCFETLESFDLAIVENATTFQTCKNEFITAFKDKMIEAGCDMRKNALNKELEAHVNVGVSSPMSYINSICEHAQERQVTKYYSDITAGSPRHIDIAEFYDGRTHLNEEIGSLNNQDGNFIKEYYDDKAKKELVELPEIEAMDGCRSNSIMCCW